MKVVALTWLIFFTAYGILDWLMWRHGGDDRRWYGKVGAAILYASLLTVPTMAALAFFGR